MEGWVIGTIVVRKLPRRVIDPGDEIEDFQVTTAPPIMVGSIPIYEKPRVRYSQPTYASPEARFVFALVEYPSGHIRQWGEPKWEDVDILRQSQEFEDSHPSNFDYAETRELKALVELISQALIRDGWEPCGKDVDWYGLKFRKKYAQVGAPLKWK